MSVSEDRTVQSTPTTPAPGSGIADPAPLGLAAFALTTFLLSAKNAGWMTHATGNSWLPFALAYGGLAQLLAAMWGFAKKNVVAATGFGTFGAFWVGLGFYILLVVNPAIAAVKTPIELAAAITSINHDLGLDLARVRRLQHVRADPGHSDEHGLVRHLPPLWITLIVLCIGNFNAGAALLPTTTIKIGGYLGVLTALVAWYTSAADFSTGMGGKLRFPVGPPLSNDP